MRPEDKKLGVHTNRAHSNIDRGDVLHTSVHTAQDMRGQVTKQHCTGQYIPVTEHWLAVKQNQLTIHTRPRANLENILLPGGRLVGRPHWTAPLL